MSKMFGFLIFQPFFNTFCILVEHFGTVMYSLAVCYKTILVLYIFSVLFPGGGANIYGSPYEKTAKILFNLAVKANDAGDVFPMWGTCLGFQMLMSLGADGEDVTTPVDAEDYSIPLNFSQGWLINFSCSSFLLKFMNQKNAIHVYRFGKGVREIRERKSDF